MVTLMLGLWLGLSVIAVSPDLHHLLHKDSQRATHHCLIAQLGKGSLLFGFASDDALAPALVSEVLPPFATVYFLATSDHRLSPSRAPPSVSSSNTVVG